MKTYLTYGFAMAMAGALLNLGFFFGGLHDDPAKFGTAQALGSIGGLAIGIGCIVLGTKARRAELPAHQEFGYGSALGAGVMIVLVAALVGIVTNYLYFNVINPGFNELIVKSQLDKMEANGMNSTQLEQVEKGVRMMTRPAIQAAFGFVAAMFFGTVIALISAAFLKRAASDEPPALA